MAYQNPPYGYGQPSGQGPPPPVPPRQPPNAGPPLHAYQGGQYYPPPPQPPPTSQQPQYLGSNQTYQQYPPPPQRQYGQPPPGGFYPGPQGQPYQHPPSQPYYPPPPPGGYGQQPPPPAPAYGQAPPPGGYGYQPSPPQYSPPPAGTSGVNANQPPPPPPRPSYTPSPATPAASSQNASAPSPQLSAQGTYQYPPHSAQHLAGGTNTTGYRPPPQDAPAQGTYQYPPHSSLSIGQQSPATSTSSSFHPTPASTPAVSSPPPVSHRPVDRMDNMASQFGNMSMNDGDRGLASSRAGASTPPPLPQPPPTVRRTGPPNDILQYCPENSPVLFPLEWYRLPQVPNFLICNFCHAKHIRQSSFASSFEGVRQQEGTATLCRFCVPRVKNVLWPEAVRSGDLAPFTAYAIKRARISDCCGEEGVSAAAGIKWLVAKNSLAPHFLTCEACFEDRIVGSAFESQLEPPQLGQRTGQTWTCDVGSTGYISRAFEKFGTKGRNDWPACVAAINNRLPLPVCEGKNVDRDCNKWFTPRREIYDFAICETCYLDKVALTEFEHEFTAWAAPKQSTLGLLGGALLQGRAPQAPQCVCDMTGMPISAALDAALMRHDFSVWWNAANAIRRAPACTTNGLRGGTWYTLQGGCNDFDICTACHAGIVRPLGLDQFFQQGTRTGDEVVVCDFCPVQPRFPHLMIHLVRSLLVGVFEHFESYVRKWSGIPLCQGRKPLENCIWYGFYDAAFCTNCYEEVVAGSALDSALAVRGVRVTGRTMCCLYSPRMRQKWRDACAAGSPDGFIAAAKYRMEVYQKTIPKVELMEAVKLSKVATSAHQAVLSVQYQGMAGLAELSGSTDAYWHRYGGNYYSTWDGAHSAQLSDASRAGLMDAIRGDDIVLKAQLLTMWKQVE